MMMGTSLAKQKKNDLKAKNTARAIDEMRYRSIDVPWDVYRLLGTNKKIDICGDQASLAEDGDFGDLEEIRYAIQWLADQFGGKVRWEDKN
jgi:hypothetical protein